MFYVLVSSFELACSFLPLSFDYTTEFEFWGYLLLKPSSPPTFALAASHLSPRFYAHGGVYIEKVRRPHGPPVFPIWQYHRHFYFFPVCFPESPVPPVPFPHPVPFRIFKTSGINLVYNGLLPPIFHKHISSSQPLFCTPSFHQLSGFIMGQRKFCL